MVGFHQVKFCALSSLETVGSPLEDGVSVIEIFPLKNLNDIFSISLKSFQDHYLLSLGVDLNNLQVLFIKYTLFIKHMLLFL